MLAHTPKGMSASEMRYNRARYIPRRRELAQQWADMIMEGVIGLEFRAPAEDIGIFSHPHPTFSESIKEAALDASGKRAIHI